MFTDAHSASAVCTPSRYALLTGQSPLQAENGKIKKDAPPAQLYDLEKDVNQTTNLYKQYPEIVKEMEAILDMYILKAERKNRR